MSLLVLQRDSWSAPFFDAAARGHLMILHCGDCGESSAPQARRCAVCSSDNIQWVESPGRGEIVTWTTPHVRNNGSTEPAYVVAIVQLLEGPWIYAHSSPDMTLRAGQLVSIDFSPVTGGESLPVLAARP